MDWLPDSAVVPVGLVLLAIICVLAGRLLKGL